MQLKKPLFWDFKKPNLYANFLRIFSIFPIVYNKLFINKVVINNLKKILIVNIYLGGTGKTPTCIYINQKIKNSNNKTAFIKKFYKDQIDEQNLLKKNGNLICSSSRIKAANIAKSKRVDLAIFDDGLQDKNIDYDIKIACFNSKSLIGNGLVLPAGPLREQIKNIKNYDAAIINGNGENISKFKKYLKNIDKNLRIFEGRYLPDKKVKKLQKKKFIAFSGIGNHFSFLDTLNNNNIKILKHFQFPDHYNYEDKDISLIKKQAKILNCKIITTEKDYFRLNNKNKKNIEYLKIKIKIKKEKEFINFLKKI